jgi:hypothetical protein
MIHHIQTKIVIPPPIAITIVSASPKIRAPTELPQLIDVGIDAIYFCRKILQHVDVGNKDNTDPIITR